ncbi:flagellar hook protein FlgE [Bradyrhizobium paxllaeri]|uniref:flagellar hook protein FlgE n=1 Tax=Bradyrhizobium paxllaeri TaxID=190148 RepID=UPI0008103FD8|nr:flagellar hook-basal body complex protein [Bradyrhizobium paxllaeri]
MSITAAMNTAISGLTAQSYAMGNISGNIANAHTPGYKRIDTSFADLVTDQGPKRAMAGPVLAEARFTTSLQGPLNSTGVATNMAINGSGFFTVMQRTSDSGAGQSLYTRRGDFGIDKDGYLVNGTGGHLLGNNLDPVSGRITSSGLIKIANASLPGRQTTKIDYAANLPKMPITTASAAGDSAPYAVPAAVVTDPSLSAPDLTKKVTGTAQVSAFLDKSIMGPSLAIYTSGGAPVSLSTRWAKVQDAAPSSAPPKNAIWNLFYASSSGASKDSDWINVGSAFSFDSSGKFLPPASANVTRNGNASVKIPQVTVDGAIIGDITMNLGTGGLTQYAASAGTATTSTLTQDGYAAGTLKSLSVSADGTIIGAFSNEMTAPVATAGIVNFTNPNGLRAASGGNYEQTRDSGPPIAGLNGGTIVGGNIEGSNSDLASQFSRLIATQQAYSANVKVMTTSQQMMSELLNAMR